MAFLLYFCLIFVEALSENVVAFYRFDFKTSPIYFFRKATKFEEKSFGSFGVMLQKTSNGGGHPLESPDRINVLGVPELTYETRVPVLDNNMKTWENNECRG